MKNLEMLARTVTYACTSQETANFPDAGNKTEVQKVAHVLVDSILEQRETMMLMSRMLGDRLSDLSLFDVNYVRLLITEAFEHHFEEHGKHLHPNMFAHIKTFIPPGVSAVCNLVYATIRYHGFGMKPDALKKYKEGIVDSSNILARNSGMISAHIRGLLENNAHSQLFDGNDMSGGLCSVIEDSFMRQLVLNDGLKTELQKRGHCAAWEKIPEFASLVFDMTFEMYKAKFQQFANESGEIPPEKIEKLKKIYLAATGKNKKAAE